MPSIRKITLSIGACLLGFWSMGQINSVSPYSRFGVGERSPNIFGRHAALGFSSLALRDPVNINFANPASLTELKLSTFHMGGELSAIRQEQRDPDITLENGRAGFRFLAFGLPLTEWWSSAVSLQPYSFKGYDISSVRFLDSLAIQDNFTGNGGLNVFYWGNGFEVAEGLSLGFNVKYFFGKTEESTTVTFDRAIRALVTKTDEIIQAKGAAFDFGAQYRHDLANDFELGLGLSLSNNSNLSTTVERFIYTADDFPESLDDFPLDTLSASGTVEGEMTLPGEIGLGISIAKNHEQIWWPAWGMSIDVEQYLGSEYRPATGSGNQFLLNDAYRLEWGAYTTPRFTIKSWERLDNLLVNTEYRIGAFYHQGPIVLDGQSIDEYGITFGLGIPIKTRNQAPGQFRLSTLNLGLIAGNRGSLANNLIRERYLQLYLDLTINDKWFIKYKYR